MRTDRHDKVNSRFSKCFERGMLYKHMSDMSSQFGRIISVLHDTARYCTSHIHAQSHLLAPRNSPVRIFKYNNRISVSSMSACVDCQVAQFLVHFWFWGFCTVCKVNLPTTFRKPLSVPSLLVMSKNAKNQRRGMLPYIWVELRMGLTVVSETSSVSSPCTQCKNPKTKQHSLQGESLKPKRISIIAIILIA